MRKFKAPYKTLVAVSTALTAVVGFITMPLYPVLVTLQVLFTHLGAVLSGYLGALSQMIYVLLGGVGLPVFAGGKAGFGVLVGRLVLFNRVCCRGVCYWEVG